MHKRPTWHPTPGDGEKPRAWAEAKRRTGQQAVHVESLSGRSPRHPLALGAAPALSGDYEIVPRWFAVLGP